MKTRWYVSLTRPWETRFNIGIREALGGNSATFQETTRSLPAITALLQTLKPQGSAHVLFGKKGELIVEADDIPEGETVQNRMTRALERLESTEGSAQLIVVGPSWDEMEAIVAKWREQWKAKRPATGVVKS